MRLAFLFFFLFLTGLVGCAAGSYEMSARTPMAADESAPGKSEGKAVETILQETGTPALKESPLAKNSLEKPSEKEPPKKSDRMIIYTGVFKIGTFSLQSSLRDARAIAVKFEGFISEEAEDRIVFRVPIAKFDAAVQELEKIGKVESRKITSQDITEEFLDLQLRVKAKKAYLAQLEEIQKRGGAIKEVLEVQKEIGTVIEEIERMEGRLRYYADRVAYSTISVQFTTVVTKKIDDRFKLPFAWLDDLGLEKILAR